jgi:transcriptional regulator with XRE-family HTH domain
MSESKNLDLYTIGNNIRDLRERKQLTQMKVVNDLGISYTHYAKIEEGMRSMSLKMLFMLVTYFNTDANTILGIDVKEVA